MTKEEKSIRIVFLTASIVCLTRLMYDLGRSLGYILTTKTED